MHDFWSVVYHKDVQLNKISPFSFFLNDVIELLRQIGFHVHSNWRLKMYLGVWRDFPSLFLTVASIST